MTGGRVEIERWECSYLRARSREAGWLLVYGRRKTGKTWLLRRCWGWSLYATVGLEGDCIVEERGRARSLPAAECVEEALRLLRRGASVVLDEFQRLPERLWHRIAAEAEAAEGGLALCGSSMGLARRAFSRRSPLLGLLEAFHVDIASYWDTATSLRRAGLGSRDALLWAVVARDPWLLRHLRPRGEPWEALASRAMGLVAAARSLVGEVFEEEGRQLTRLYDAALALLARGYWRAAEIAEKLYEAGLVSAPHPGSATGVLRVLEEIGLVERVPLWRTRGGRVYYRHRSSLTRLLYSAADRVEELGEPPDPEALRALYGVELQFNLGEMLAAAHGLRRGYSIPHGGPDIDVVLLDQRGRAQWGYEVKTGRLTASEAREAAERIKSLGIPHAGAAALGGLPPEAARVLDEALDAEALAEMAERLSAEARRAAERGEHPRHR